MQRAAVEGHIGLHAAALYDDARLSGELLRLDDVKGVGSCNPELVHVLHHPRQQLGASLDLNGLGDGFLIVGQNRESAFFGQVMDTSALSDSVFL